MRADAPPRPPGAPTWADDVDAPPGAPGGPTPFGPPPRPSSGGSGRGLKIFGWVLLAVVILGIAATALWYTSRPNPPSYAIGSCVQKSGDGAVAVSCSAPNAYKIVLKVTDHTACPDQNNPYITLTGSTPTVYCLAPAQGGTTNKPTTAPSTHPPSAPPSS
jgi:hypothetical protein